MDRSQCPDMVNDWSGGKFYTNREANYWHPVQFSRYKDGCHCTPSIRWLIDFFLLMNISDLHECAMTTVGSRIVFIIIVQRP